MLDESLRALVAGGERFDVEFKGEEREPLNDHDLVEAVVCLANGAGGDLLVGVEDDRRVTGARPRHGSYTDPRRVEALIANNTVPSLAAQAEVSTLNSQPVLRVRVPHARTPTSNRAGVFKRRAVGSDGRPACVPFHFHEMQGREASRGALDHSALVLPEALWSDLDPLEFERLRQTIRRNPGRADAALLELSDEEIAKALGLVGGDSQAERIHIAGLLVLGREEALRRLLPTHEVAFQVLSGTRVLANEFFRGPLIRISEDLTTRFKARNEEQEIPLGPIRIGVPDYSPSAFREAVHNAMVHRDYTRLGAVHVQWHGDRMEISNPGGFVEGVRLDNLLVTPPRPRNPVLADAFKRIGLVERTGRGIDTIFEGQLRYGRPAPDYSLSAPESVHVVLPGGQANLALTRLIVEQDLPHRRLTVDDMLVLNAVERERRINIPRAAVLIQRGEPVARAVLERLVERGILQARGERQRRIYHFSAATYQALGLPVAYPRTRGFEPIQQEQMILQYVDAYGRIARGQTAELCQIDVREATRLLQRLVARGELVPRGSRRGSFYERPGH